MEPVIAITQDQNIALSLQQHHGELRAEVLLNARIMQKIVRYLFQLERLKAHVGSFISASR